MNILFVCSKNKWRSRTAFELYKHDPRFSVRSAGIRKNNNNILSQSDIQWADLILVMEKNHKSWILDMWRDMVLPPIENLDIPDEYEYMDVELIEMIKNGVEYFLKRYINNKTP